MATDKHWIKHPFYPIILQLAIKAWFFTVCRELLIYKLTEKKKLRKIKYIHIFKSKIIEKIKRMSFVSLSSHITISLLWQTFFCRLNRMRPKNVNMRFHSLHYSIHFIFFCYTKLRTDPYINKDFFLFGFFSKDSLSCSKVGATHV